MISSLGRNTGRHIAGQRGAALIIVLLLLLIVTLLGLTAMRGTLLQERMSGNAVARSVAFQAAESVLREAESLAATSPVVPVAGCMNGLCARPVGGADSVWRADGFWEGANGWREANESSPEDRLLYVVEDMGERRIAGPGCTTAVDLTSTECASGTASGRYYRIVAFSRLENGTEVILQSTFFAP